MKNNVILALAVSLAIAWGVLGQAAAAGENLPGLATPGKLVVGLDDTFAPMGFRDPAGNLVGFDIDLAKAVGQQLGLEVVFQPVEWSAKEMELAARNVDCLWNGMSRTKDREVSMTLSKDYLNNKLVIMTNPKVTIEKLEDLANYQVGTQAASASLDAVKASPVFPLIMNKLHEYSTYDECILDMQAGRIDAMIVDEVLGQYKNKNLGTSLKVAPVDFGDDLYVIGFRRTIPDNSDNEQLRRAVEDAIQAVIDKGTGKEISEKWFGANLLLNMK